jgi:choline kinase
MTSISEAVILMAGMGSRLRKQSTDVVKPLTLVGGRPLVAYTLDALARAGVKRVIAIVGHESEKLMDAVKPIAPPGVELSFVHNREWQKQNGISLFAASGKVSSPFLLTMSDHIYQPSIIELVGREADAEKLNLAIDRKLKAIFDVEDATKVQTRGQGIAAIGKDLREFDAIDTGIFVCPHEIFSYLEQARSRNGGDDCSLSDAVRLMARDDKVRCIDIRDAWWQDVDTPEMLREAEKMVDRWRGAAAIAP